MFKPWLDKYPEAISSEIDEIDFKSLVEVFENSFEKFPNHCAISNMGKELTYAQLDKKSQAIATYLQQTLKLQQGDRVAIMMPNLIQYPIILLGILRSGMCVVNINPLYTPRELKHQLVDSDAKAIFIASNFATTLEKVIAETKVEHVVLTRIGDELTLVKRSLINFIIAYVKKMVPKYKLPDAISYRHALRVGRKGQYIRPIVNTDDKAFLQYTGGTTGGAKGAILTHRNMIRSLQQGEGVFGVIVDPGKETMVTALPLYHAFALTVNCLLFIKRGGKNILITNPRDMDGFVATLKKEPFTFIAGLNTLFIGLMRHPKFDDIDFKQAKTTLAGGMATQEAVADEWRERTGTEIIEGYGLTECSPMVSINSYNTKKFNGSVGLPMPGTDLRLRADDGTIIETFNVAGELEIKGPQVMQGYWKSPEATAEVLSDDGWLKTGDVALFCEEGLLRLVDRKKDMILVSGFNVYPNEIEGVLVKMDGILEGAVIGVDNPVTGESVKAFVVLGDHSITVDMIRSHCREHLTGYKRPKIIEIVTELPKNNVGKVLRRALKDR